MCATYSTISVLMKLNDTLHHQCVNEIEWHTPPSVCWWNWMIHTTISVLMSTHWWWCVQFNFINSLMVVCVIQFIYDTDGGVCHSISPTDWWWYVSFNFIKSLMVVCVIQFQYTTISVLMKLNDTLHHQCVDEIEWYTPLSVCWWNWMIHTTISVLMKLNDTLHHQWVNEIVWHSTIRCHLIASTHWLWSASSNFINTLMVEYVAHIH
jgi:hypothetical protein